MSLTQTPLAAEVIAGFRETFGTNAAMRLFSAPGRTEICGNHTDHQHGRVMAAAVNLEMVAAAGKSDSNLVRILSKGYPMITVDITDLTVVPDERNTTAALVRGMAAAFKRKGVSVSGFDAYMTATVLPGSGLSSSAALEVLMGVIFNHLFCDGRVGAVEIAQMGQYAENIYFGKPCGLMDQMASSVGGMICIDFNDPQKPVIEKLDFDFAASGHALCIIDSRASHADLTDEYAAIPAEMKAVAQHFGQEYLRDVAPEDFFTAIPALRTEVGDRAVLRAIHFFRENEMVLKQADALRRNDFPAFLALVRESGRSSWMYLQDIVPAGSTVHQEMAIALALCDTLLGKRGAFRVHGGGFAGTVQAFVPNDMLEAFRSGIEAVLGEGACHILAIRPYGGCAL